MTSQGTCCKCGQRIVGIKHSHEGKAYCDICYNALMSELAEMEKQKGDLYKYICKLFGKYQCPDTVISAIDKAIASGKKVSGVKVTLWWYYEIEGHDTDNILAVGKVIDDQYENAKSYVNKQKEIRKINEQVDLSQTPVQNITIKSSRNTKKWKPNYRMEDL